MRRLLLTFFVAFAAHDAEAQAPRPQPTPGLNVGPAPVARIEAPQDSPLRLSVRTKWVEWVPRGLELFVEVENVGDAVVRAYATRDSSDDAGERVCLLHNAPAPGKALKPGEKHGTSTWRSFDPATSAPLKRSLDFVELGDGRTLGPDVCKSAESLAGQRAGASKAGNYLREVFANGGAPAVVKAVRHGLPEITPPQDRSAVWQEGFRLGARVYADRVKHAAQEWGEGEVEAALRRPFDASGAGAP
jgi:hypothetical protein